MQMRMRKRRLGSVAGGMSPYIRTGVRPAQTTFEARARHKSRGRGTRWDTYSEPRIRIIGSRRYIALNLILVTSRFPSSAAMSPISRVY
jgi:hypothetical protein